MLPSFDATPIPTSLIFVFFNLIIEASPADTALSLILSKYEFLILTSLPEKSTASPSILKKKQFIYHQRGKFLIKKLLRK